MIRGGGVFGREGNRPFDGEPDFDDRPPVGSVAREYRAAVAAHGARRDGKSETNAAGYAIARRVDPVEGLKDCGKSCFWNAGGP
jgi:hypothetical protein